MRRRRRIPSGFTYISGCVKYTMFFFNFIFWLMGLLLMGIGIYAIMDKWSSGEAFKLNTIFDVIFNIGFLLLIIGFVVFIVSFAGCIGALRENMCLLRYRKIFISIIEYNSNYFQILFLVFVNILPCRDDNYRSCIYLPQQTE